MLKKAIWIFVAFISAGCSLNSAKTQNANDLQGSNNSSARYFDYDQVEYYFNDFDESTLENLYDKQQHSELDSYKLGVMIGEIPKSVSDSSFVRKLEGIGYTKKLISKSKFDEIDQVFSQKKSDNEIATACINIYRDILVFRKDNKIIGTVKICFGCSANEIHGSLVDTRNFGQNGEYKKLAEILRTL